MAAGEALFDAGLAAEQPVHGVVEFVLIDIAEAEEFSQGGDGGFGGQGACGGEFGAGVDDAGDDEGDGEIAVPAGGAGDEGVEAESSEGSEDGGDVPVGEAAAAGEGFVGGDEGFAFEDAAECFDGVIGEFGEVGARPSRKDSRRRTAGGEFRLGTRSTYMTPAGVMHPYYLTMCAIYMATHPDAGSPKPRAKSFFSRELRPFRAQNSPETSG